MNKKRMILGTASITLALSAVTAVVVSCGSTKETNDEWIRFHGANHNVNDFINTLAEKGQTADANQIKDILKKSVSFLYEKEQKASENFKKLKEQSIRDHAKRVGEDPNKAVKDASIQALETISKIKDRVTSEFDDEKNAYKEIHGYGWEKTWPTELTKNKKYGGARSDKEAIDNLLNAQLSPHAFGRFTIKQNVEWYKGDINKKGFEWLKKLKDLGMVFSNDKNTSLDKLNDDEKIIVIGTNSKDVNQQNIDSILVNYLNKYDPMLINHFLLKITPNENEGFAPWKIDSLDALKSWLMPSKLANKTTIEAIGDFKGVHWDTKTKKFVVDEGDTNLLNSFATGNSAGTQKIGGSLGIQDELDYVSGMVPGFALPILTTMGEDSIQKDKPGWMKENAKNPLDGISTKILDALAKEAFSDKTTDFKTNFPNAKMDDLKSWIKAIERLVKAFSGDEKEASKKILEISGRVIRDAFVGIGESERDLIYKYGNNKMAISKFGVHITTSKTIQQIKTEGGFKNNKQALLSTIKSDVQRGIEGETAFFNTLQNISKHSTDDMAMIEILIKDANFKKYLKSQENFGVDSSQIKGNTYPKYTDAIINKDIPKYIANYKLTQEIKRAKGATDKLKTWMNTNFQNETLKGQTNGKVWDEDGWKQSLNDIYNAARKIAKKGVGA